jgi:hypothetical protein
MKHTLTTLLILLAIHSKAQNNVFASNTGNALIENNTIAAVNPQSQIQQQKFNEEETNLTNEIAANENTGDDNSNAPAFNRKYRKHNEHPATSHQKVRTHRKSDRMKWKLTTRFQQTKKKRARHEKCFSWK